MPEATPSLPSSPETLPDDVTERIRTAIRDAQEMLEFAVADGLPVPDDVIEKIQQAVGSLDPNHSLSSQDRAEFEKAYRELAHALSPLTLKEVRRETAPLGQRWKRHGCTLAVMGLVVSYPLFLVGELGCRQLQSCDAGEEWRIGVGVALCGILAGFALWWGAELFTGAVTNRKLNKIIHLCYVFTFLALSLSILPFVGIAFFPALPHLFSTSPVGIMRGCAEAWSADGERNEIPREIRCAERGEEKTPERQSYQWIVNIGGSVLLQTEAPAEVVPKDAKPYHAERWHVQGGLVVPLYVVVLALMGSAVSMTRRVPEYQRDAFGLHETLSNARARENLVFQIMQVFAAPLVVMTAYYLFAPESRASTVLLGFASGFASEPILLAIRGLADKLRPAGDEAVVDVFVSPTSVTLSPGESRLFTATIRGTTNTAVTWAVEPSAVGVLTSSGLFTAPNTVEKKQAITIVATSVADPSKAGRAVINLQPKEESK